MHLKSRLSLVTILGGAGLVLASVPTVAQAAGGMGGTSGASGASGGKAGVGGANGGAAGAAGTTGASGFTQAVKPKDGGAVAGTGNKTATYAVTCAEDITGKCAKTGSIVFDKKQELEALKGIKIDTDWIPKNSDFQVRFALEIPAYTHVHLETPFVAQWPEAITLTTPGTRKTGELDFDYSLKTLAKARFEKVVLGQNIKFETDIPFVPKFDFGVSGSRTFDPWAWDGIRGEGSTDPLTLLDLNIAGFAGVPSQVGKAGVKVDLYGILGVKYTTNRISIAPSDGPITKDQSSTVHDFQQGAWAEYKFHPEGTLDYDGTMVLEPKLYISVLNGAFEFDYPITQFKQDIKIPSTPYIFDDQLVHVPLPDLRLPKEGDVIDIGKVTVGEPKLFQIALPNIGEAAAVATYYLEDAKTFQVLNKTATAEPAKDLVAKLAFYAAAPGPFATKLLVASNDPDSPYIVITLKGESEGLPPDPERPPPMMAGAGGAEVEPPDEEEPEGGAGGIKATGGAGGKKARGNAVPTSGDEGGCGCRVTPQNEAPGGAAFSLLALTSFLALRRSRARKAQSVVPPARNTAR